MRMNQSENSYAIGSVESSVENFLSLEVYIYKEHSTPATVIMNFFVPNHDDKAWYFSTPCHFRFGIQNFPTPCVIYQDSLFDLPSEWF